jgi:hypothetical protein
VIKPATGLQIKGVYEGESMMVTDAVDDSSFFSDNDESVNVGPAIV